MNNRNNINTSKQYYKNFSAAIAWLRFPLIFLIIMLHCYSVVKLDGPRIFYFEIIYPFSLWLGETGVPGFFFISGYLFFLSKKSYGQKLKSRVQTLLIPYMLWNSLLLALYLLAYLAGHPQEINHKNIAEFSIIDYIRLFWDRGDFSDGNFVPLLCPFWYIRNLLIMSILSPLLYYIVKYGREFFLLVVTLWWMTLHHNAFIPQTVLFFSLGAYFSIMETNPLEMITNRRKTFVILFIVFALADMATHTIISSPWNLQFHRLSLLFNIPILLLLADYCARKGYSYNLLSNAAFIVFAVHYPIVVILRKMCTSSFPIASDGIHIVLYFLCVVVSTTTSLLIYIILDKYFPKLKKILSGNR